MLLQYVFVQTLLPSAIFLKPDGFLTAAAKLIPDGMHQTLNPDSLTIRHTQRQDLQD